MDYNSNGNSQELLKLIEQLRNELKKVACSKSINAPEVIDKSKELDDKLNKYYKQASSVYKK